MGLPQLDCRVPEGTWFKSALAGRFRTMPGLSATGALAWPYKIAVVAVMAIVACGTLVTFGSAGAETPSSADISALPGSDEASPSVEGQIIPPATSLLNANDLMSSLNLTDYSPGDNPFELPEDEDNDDNDDSDDGDEDSAKKPTSPTSRNPTTSPTTSSDDEDSDEDSEPVEGPRHKQWVQDKAEYEDERDEWESQKSAYEKCLAESLQINLGQCEDKKPGDEPDDPGSEPPFTS